MIHNKEHYLNIFQISEEEMDGIVAEGLAKGGSYCDLYFENTSCGSLMLRDGEVTSGGLHVDFGAGVRVLSGDKTGYAYSETVSRADLIASARAAAAIADSPAEILRPASPPVRGVPNPSADRYPSQRPWRSALSSDFLPFLHRLESEIQKRDSRIVKIIAALSWQVSDCLMYNSLRELKYDTRPLGSVSVSVIFQQGERIENKSVSRSFRTGTEMLSESLIQEMASLAVQGADAQFEARRPQGGQMSVVMGAGASGILLHEAMGHAFEADFNRKGQSIFAGKMGQQICASGISIFDDGTLKGSRGALNYDDEGVPGQKTCMVERGVLTSYLHDRISAKFYGVRPTGNGRRESFRCPPLPRMRTTYMENGDGDREGIIASVKKGIYVDEFSNGQVKIGEGDFTFYVKSGYLIENGRLTAPVKDINIIGNGPQALADIVAVGHDLKIDEGAWICGKQQNVPVSCGIPTVLVKSLTVGGE